MGDSGALRKKPRKTAPNDHAWAQLPEAELLQLRFMDLRLSLSGTWLDDCFDALNAELKARGLQARAHAWLSDEWFSPDTTPGIAFPFYLAHPRLKRLEGKMMGEIEGGTRRECMRILRHEAGHVIQHSYGLHRRKHWQDLFGLSSKRYPNYYRPNPVSKNFVQHLPRWYAQSHPDEDFAETFAVWLTPRSNWRRLYDGWGALEKLEYVDELMQTIAGKKPALTNKLEVDPIGKLKMTLGEHYKKKLEHYAVERQTSYDGQLRRIFSDQPRHHASPAAATFIRRHRAVITDLVTERTGEDQPNLAAVIDDIVERCRQLNLRAPASEQKMRLTMTAQLTTTMVRSRYSASRRQWFAL